MLLSQFVRSSPIALTLVYVCVLSDSAMSICDPMDCSLASRLLCPWDFPGKNIGVDYNSLLQEIFLT